MTAVLFKKELRALAPAWIALSGALVLTGSKSGLDAMTAPLMFIGPCVLGALSLGYEFGNGTLETALTLPIRRSHLLLVKQFALGVTIAAFAGVALEVFSRSSHTLWGWKGPGQSVLVAVVFGLFVAPWLTMVFRNALAGAVFSIVLPGLLVIVGGTMGASLEASAADALSAAMLRIGTIVFGLLAATMIWPTFARLEALGARGSDLRAPWDGSASSGTSASAVRPNKAWLQLKKELHLRQLPAALAIVYAVAAVAIAFTVHEPWKAMVSADVAVFYAGFVAVLTGALVTAGERELGTLEWQTSLPIRASEQWLGKVLVAGGIAWVMGVMWPLVLRLWLLPPAPGMMSIFPTAYLIAFFAVFLHAVYVSSLCRRPLTAAVVTVPTIMATYLLTSYFAQTSVFWMVRLTRAAHPYPSDRIVFPLLLLLLGGLMLRFAYTNHRTAHRSWKEIAGQIAALAAAVPIVFALAVIGELLIR